MLATLTQLEKHLQTDLGADTDGYVAEYLAQAQAACESYCRQPLEWAASIVDTFEDAGTWHQLSQFPVTGVTSIVEDTYTLTVTDEYLWYSDGRLRRVAGSVDWRWTTNPNGVVVTFDAGYGTGAPVETIPPDLSLAIVTYAAALFRHGAAYAADGAKPIKSITLEGSDTIQYAVASEPLTEQPLLGQRSKQLLGPYMRRIM